MKKIIWLLCFLFISSLAYAQEISNNIGSLLSSEGKIMYGDEPNSIVVTDYLENLQRIADYLEAIDVSPQQVLIEARVVEVKLQKEHSLGVNWQLFADKKGLGMGQFKVYSAATANGIQQAIPYKPTFYPPTTTTPENEETPFTVTIFDENINMVLKALANSLDTNILSAPRITTVNNREAEIKIIQSLPWAEPQLTANTATTGGTSYSTTWKAYFEEVGIILKATPTINDDGKIAMILTPEVSEKVSDYPLTASAGDTSVSYTIPIIDRRSASTKVVIGNGQTLIIGGLIKENNISGETKVPFFGDLPILGYLFKSKKNIQEKTELLIFVSPTIITPEEYVKMARQEKYGVGSKYIQEREGELQRLLLMEEKDEARQNRFTRGFESLNQKQQVLIEQREKINEKILNEGENLEELKGTLNELINKRRDLEKVRE